MPYTKVIALGVVSFFLAVNVFIVSLMPTADSPSFHPMAKYSLFLDPFSESFHADSARSFLKFGLLHNAGLATLSKDWMIKYTGRFKEYIIDPSQEYFVYTHYPSTSDLIAGIGAKLFGLENVQNLRILPLIINGLLLFVFFSHALLLFPNKKQQAFFMAMFFVVPIGWNGMHTFTHFSYALYLSLAFIGVMLPVFQSLQPTLKRHAKSMALLFGFLAGLFTFDYFFIVVGIPLAVCLLFHGRETFSNKTLKRQWLILGFLAGVGFAVAHAVHFMQVVAYYGSFTMAFEDIFGAVLYRITGNAEHYTLISGMKKIEDCLSPYCGYLMDLGPIKGRLMLLFDYLTLWTSFNGFIVFLGQDLPERYTASLSYRIQNISGYLFLPIILWGGLAMGATAIFKKRFLNPCVLLFLSTLAISSLWLFLMKNHGIVHIHVLPRHYYFCFIMMLLFVTRMMDIKGAPRSS
jgi:hypothetical protein